MSQKNQNRRLHIQLRRYWSATTKKHHLFSLSNNNDDNVVAITILEFVIFTSIRCYMFEAAASECIKHNMPQGLPNPIEHKDQLQTRGVTNVNQLHRTNFAAWFHTKGASSLLFCIGGPYGHGRQLRRRADVSIKLSSLVLNHEIALVVLIEQLYR
ncbi:RNA methyltransferase [Forsythia ovata]|uniref:RNA methyltransferase n=1 Tax=Forsythia ovata TaxID=205694 RepID=A0ABD1T6J0_9LAMI